MRYAYGILLGAVLPGAIFLVAAAIRITGIGAEETILLQLWAIYKIWFLVSIAIVLVPPLVIFITQRELFREFLIYETGGLGFFSPLWLFISTEISGDSWYNILINGIHDGLIGFGPSGDLIGIYVSNVILIPFLLFSFILGLFFLRPSFIAKYGYTGEIPELKTLKEDTEAKEESPLEKEMPDIKPPETTADSVAMLREVLIESGTTDPAINLILNSGIGSITDLAATSAEQLASLTGMGKREAEALLMTVQKKAWFGDI